MFNQLLLLFLNNARYKRGDAYADFMPKVVIGGNKVTIKTPLIATRYPLIIKELSISVANVALN